jgi:hypothetical protein
MSIGKHRESWVIATALLTVIALVVAPLCSPLCAARHCASGKATASGSEESCHHEAASSNGASSSHFTSAGICYSSELPPAVLNTNNEVVTHLEQSVASHSTVAVTHAAEIVTLPVFTAELRYQDGSAKPPLSTLSHTAVLRI